MNTVYRALPGPGHILLVRQAAAAGVLARPEESAYAGPAKLSWKLTGVKYASVSPTSKLNLRKSEPTGTVTASSAGALKFQLLPS